MSTAFEQVLQAAEAALLAAGLAVKRHQADDEWTAADCPLVIVRRHGTRRVDGAPIGREYHQLSFAVHCLVGGAADWETAVDELHVQVHAALIASPVLAGYGVELQATDSRARSGNETIGELAAVYALVPVMAPDLTLI